MKEKKRVKEKEKKKEKKVGEWLNNGGRGEMESKRWKKKEEENRERKSQNIGAREKAGKTNKGMKEERRVRGNKFVPKFKIKKCIESGYKYTYLFSGSNRVHKKFRIIINYVCRYFDMNIFI